MVILFSEVHVLRQGVGAGFQCTGDATTVESLPLFRLTVVQVWSQWDNLTLSGGLE